MPKKNIVISIESPNLSAKLFSSLGSFQLLCADEEHKLLNNKKYSTEIRNNIIENQHAYVIGGILCATSFLEAKINEIFEGAMMYMRMLKSGITDKILSNNQILVIKNLAYLKDNLDRNLRSLEKYQLALMVTNNIPFDKAKKPYQDVYLIFALRNLLVHYEPEWIESYIVGNYSKIRVQKIEQKLKGKFLPNKHVDSSSHFFPDKCLSKGCLDWVITSVMTFIDMFHEKIGLPKHLNTSTVAKK